MSGPGVLPLKPQATMRSPGATSWLTGSATRWKTFTPSLSWYGSVELLGVTTGV